MLRVSLELMQLQKHFEAWVMSLLSTGCDAKAFVVLSKVCLEGALTAINGCIFKKSFFWERVFLLLSINLHQTNYTHYLSEAKVVSTKKRHQQNIPNFFLNQKCFQGMDL